MRAKTSDFKSLFPVYSGKRSLLTFAIHMVWKKMTNSVKFHHGALTITFLMMIFFAGIAFLKTWSQLLQASIHALPFHLLQKKKETV